jgi:hypothetical protein
MVILKGLPFLVAKISNNRLVPEHYEQREIWHKPTGVIAPLWMRKLARRDKKLWLPEGDVPEGDVVHITLPTHTKDEKKTDSDSLHEMAGVRHQIVEVPHDKKYDV